MAGPTPHYDLPFQTVQHDILPADRGKASHNADPLHAHHPPKPVIGDHAAFPIPKRDTVFLYFHAPLNPKHTVPHSRSTRYFLFFIPPAPFPFFGVPIFSSTITAGAPADVPLTGTAGVEVAAAPPGAGVVEPACIQLMSCCVIIGMRINNALVTTHYQFVGFRMASSEKMQSGLPSRDGGRDFAPGLDDLDVPIHHERPVSPRSHPIPSS